MSIRGKILKTIGEVLKKSDIDELFVNQDSLDVLQLNSISFITLVVELEEAFDIEFDDEALLADRFPTLTALCEYIEEEIS